MASKADLQTWVLEALSNLNGEASVAQIAKAIWEAHELDLRASGDLFYTWQYDIRWAGQQLKKAGKLEKLSRSWVLK